MSAQLLLLASGAVSEKSWWDPYLKGSLVFVSAMILFVGTAYLLLYTNVGSRLGFLITASATAGFMTLLALAWVLAQFPQGPLGPAPRWEVREIVDSLEDASIEEVRTIRQEGEPADASDAGTIKADLDKEIAPSEADKDGELDLFGSVDDYYAPEDAMFTRGGGRKFPAWFSEKTRYAAVEFCPAIDITDVPFGEPPLDPACQPGEPRQVAVLVRDLGALRLPGFMILGGSAILFALSLVALRRYELEQAEPAEPAEDAEPASTPAASGDGQE